MRQLLLGSIFLVSVTFLSLVPVSQAAEKSAAERGRDALTQRSLNPAIWSMKAYDNAWKTWGLASKPANYEEAFRDRYGLHTAPFDNKGRPMGLLEARNFLGKGIVNNCLLCHAATIAGQTYIGLG